MKSFKLPIYALAVALIAAPSLANAWYWDDDDDDEETPFDEARLFFELNDTDGDLGIHGKIDGDEWKYLEIEDPRDRKMMQIWVQGRLRRQGLTELFFESAEPTFDDLDPEKFFRRFQEGWYDIEGRTLDGEERESEVYLSHVMPAAPATVTLNGTAAAEDCDAEELPEVSAPVTLSWAPVISAHEDLGSEQGELFSDINPDLSVLYYEVVIEIDESNFKSTALVPGDTTSFVLPTGITDLISETEEEEGEFKFEILVRTNIIDDEGDVVTVIKEVEVEDDDGNVVEIIEVPVPVPGNKSAIESCFVVVEP